MNPIEVSVEIVDWTPRWGMGALAANFARIQILLTMFDGDPDKWLEMIERTGGPDDEADVPFLAVMKGRLASDPTLLDDLRRIVSEFAERFGANQAEA
jgi:hypothetical protein